jgi:ATP-dependent helicase/nuclease subunit A
MTVHGAKGLEAPVVILPDCARPRSRDQDAILRLAGDVPAWKTPRDESPPASQAALDARRAAEAAESLRLLYVALTRAQSRLIVAAAGDVGKDDTGNPAWWHLVAEGMAAAGASGTPETGMTLASGDWAAAMEPAPPAAPRPVPALPAWIDSPAPVPAPVGALTPTDLGGAKALPGDDGWDSAAARAWGTALHRLLETLPQHPRADWPRIAAATGPANAPALLAEAESVLQATDIMDNFATGSLAEVPVTGSFAGRPMLGRIDRLLVRDASVLAIDFKSNRVLPATPAEVPEGILRQMGAYAHLLEQVFPGRAVQTAILWTRGARLMPLPCDIVRAALQRATIP